MHETLVLRGPDPSSWTITDSHVFSQELVLMAYNSDSKHDHQATFTLRANGETYHLIVDARRSLLDLIREDLDLTGTKKGCNQGACGACTVLLDGKRVLSCLTLAAQAADREVVTIEGLADADGNHPLQTAFIEHDGFQCGYCTPGQICSAVAMANEAKRGVPSKVANDLEAEAYPLSDDEIRERMSGNICRCGAYNGIVAAIRETFAAGSAS